MTDDQSAADLAVEFFIQTGFKAYKDFHMETKTMTVNSSIDELGSALHEFEKEASSISAMASGQVPSEQFDGGKKFFELLCRLTAAFFLMLFVLSKFKILRESVLPPNSRN